MTLYQIAKDAVKSLCNFINAKGELKKTKSELLEMKTHLSESKEEIQSLKTENGSLKAKLAEFDEVERHGEPYIIFKNDPLKIPYCENCWNTNKERVRFSIIYQKPSYRCPKCGMDACIEEEVV